MRLLASQIAEAVGGVLCGPDVEVDGAAFDSRTVVAGQLFVPLIADRDGHEFIDAALVRGAAAYLTSRPPAARSPVVGSAVVVADTGSALLALAGWARRRLDVPVVGVTGSVGKTSTKDLISAALGSSCRVTANQRSFNNEQGLPVTILGAPADVEVLVVEMGMRGFGEIARLCEVAAPTIGVVTSVAGAHTERVGGIEGVARAKRELVEALPRSGTAVLNADDRRVRSMEAHTSASVVTFGSAGDSDVTVESIALDTLARPSFTVLTPWGSGDVRLAVSGAHMVGNAAAAIAVAGIITGSIDDALAGLATATVSAMRMDVTRTATGAIVVNDAYNANPDSMHAAFEALAAIDAQRRVAIVGLMAELGDPTEGHRRVATHANSLSIELIAVGTDLYGVPATDDPLMVLGPIGIGDAVLIKASRAAGLERVAAELLS